MPYVSRAKKLRKTQPAFGNLRWRNMKTTARHRNPVRNSPSSYHTIRITPQIKSSLLGQPINLHISQQDPIWTQCKSLCPLPLYIKAPKKSMHRLKTFRICILDKKTLRLPFCLWKTIRMRLYRAKETKLQAHKITLCCLNLWSNLSCKLGNNVDNLWAQFPTKFPSLFLVLYVIKYLLKKASCASTKRRTKLRNRTNATSVGRFSKFFAIWSVTSRCTREQGLIAALLVESTSPPPIIWKFTKAFTQGRGSSNAARVVRVTPFSVISSGTRLYMRP